WETASFAFRSARSVTGRTAWPVARWKRSRGLNRSAVSTWPAVLLRRRLRRAITSTTAGRGVADRQGPPTMSTKEDQTTPTAGRRHARRVTRTRDHKLIADLSARARKNNEKRYAKYAEQVKEDPAQAGYWWLLGNDPRLRHVLKAVRKRQQRERDRQRQRLHD